MPPTTQICIRRDTAANFTSANPTLALGEIAYETDTRNIKVGDGTTAWTALPYINPYRNKAGIPTSNVLLGQDVGGGTNTANSVFVGAMAGRYLGTTSNSVAIGYSAQGNTGSGGGNTAVGFAAANGAGSNGNNNTAVGLNALLVNTASDITAVGANALDANTTGTNNTAVGKDALGANTTAAGSTAVGFEALSTTSTGAESTAVGYRALRLSTVGAQVAVGAEALSSLTSGARNVGIGHAVLNSAASTSDDTAVGYWAFINKTTGGQNVAVGADAGRFITAGTNCTDATSTILIGQDARPSGNSESNQIVIGYQGRGNGSNTTTIGNSSTSATHLAGNILTTGAGNAARTITARCPQSGTTASARLVAANGLGAWVTSLGTMSDTYTTNPTYPSEVANAGVLYCDAGAGLRIHSYNSALGFWVGNPGARRAYISTGGDLGIDNGNLVIGTSGKGIDFSATANSSGTMTSELLSDYEEGTWTPTYGSGITTPTYGTRFGWYVKVGNIVHFGGRISVSAGTAAAAILRIDGLPFTSTPTNPRAGGAYFTYTTDLVTPNTTALPTMYIPDNVTTISMYRNDGAAFNGTNMANVVSVVIFAGSYSTF